MNEHLPYLKSERHFRRYESFLRTITENWPAVSIFTPQAPILSTETLSSRIRIARESLRNNQWDITWNLAKFIQICDEIVVSTTANEGKVTCGPYDLIRKATPLTLPVETIDAGITTKINLVDPPFNLIEAVLVMHHHQLFIEPSVITTKGLDVKMLGEMYDVSITKEGDVYTIL